MAESTPQTRLFEVICDDPRVIIKYFSHKGELRAKLIIYHAEAHKLEDHLWAILEGNATRAIPFLLPWRIIITAPSPDAKHSTYEFQIESIDPTWQTISDQIDTYELTHLANRLKRIPRIHDPRSDLFPKRIDKLDLEFPFGKNTK